MRPSISALFCPEILTPYEPCFPRNILQWCSDVSYPLKLSKQPSRVIVYRHAGQYRANDYLESTIVSASHPGFLDCSFDECAFEGCIVSIVASSVPDSAGCDSRSPLL